MKNPKINRIKIAQELGNISENGVKYHLAKLLKQNLIIRVGSTKSGYWKIIDDCSKQINQ